MKTLMTLFSLFFSFSLFSQHVFNGIVTGEQDEPVTGAAVQIKGTFTGVITGADGRFSLVSKKPNVTLLISHLSFESIEVEAAAEAGEVTVALKPKSFLADEVIVSATRAGKNHAPSYTEVTKEELSKNNLAQDIPFLLEQTPSIVSTSDAGAGVGYTYLRIRGSDQSRINVTINGVPYNDPESQQVFWVDVPDFASSVDNIQVQRGAGVSTNGAAAFGATINILTDGLQQQPYAELSGSYGSFNTWKASAKFGTGLLKNKFTFDGRLSQIKSDGYIERASSDLKSFFASAGYYGSKTILRLLVFSGVEETYQAWWGVPESYLDSNRRYNYYNYPHEVDHYKQDNYQFLFSRQTGKSWMLNAALHYTRGKGYFGQYRGPEYNNDFGFNSKESFAEYGLSDIALEDTVLTETSLARKRWLDNHFYGATFSALYQKKKLNLTLGGAANRYTGNHYGEIAWIEFASNSYPGYRYYDGTGVKNDINMFAKADYRFSGNITVFADLQYRFVSYNINGTDNDRRQLSVSENYHFFNPKAGIAWRVNRANELFASFSIANREPARADFTDAPAGRTPLHETLRDLEIGYRFMKPKNMLSINGYFMHYKNQLALTGELNDVGAALKTNVDKSYRAGIEVVNSFKPVEKFRWDANLTYSMNRIKDFTETLYVYDGDYNFVETITEQYSNTYLSFSPWLIAGSTLAYRPVNALELAFISKYVSEQFLDNTGSANRKLDDFFVSNLRFSYTLKEKFFKEIIFTLALNNIFNAKFESNGYTFSEVYEDESAARTRVDYNYYYPQAGFNVLGGVTVRF